MRLHKIKTVFIILVLILSFLNVPAQAVTYPDTSPVAPRDAPFLLSIWTVNPETFEREDNICSGVLATKSVVVTAAHCVVDNQFLAVVVGQDNSQHRGEVLSVFKWIVHPRYSKSTKQNDIAVGLLNFDSRLGKTVALKFDGLLFPKTGARLYGWGEDQNQMTSGYPMTVKQMDYSNSANKYFKTFNRQTMIAAGFYNQREKFFAGACHGDSGGPLMGDKNGVKYLLGLVSYGSSKGCDVGIPTVYTRISYYSGFINESVKRLLSEFNSDGTTRPNLDDFSLPSDSVNTLIQKSGTSSLNTYAPLQQRGGVKTPDVQSISLQTFGDNRSEIPFGLTAVLANQIDPCAEKQKGTWILQFSLSGKQSIDYEFKITPSQGCYTDGIAVNGIAKNLQVPPALTVCNNPTVKGWNGGRVPGDGIDVVTFFIWKGCFGTSKAVWVRVIHEIAGDGQDIEPGLDMWAGPFSTKLPS